LNYPFYKIRNKLPLLAYHNFKHRVLRQKANYPYAIQYNITYKCNLKCVYCDCGIIKHKNYEMTTDEICRMLDEFVRMGTRRLSITGGEPLLKKNLAEVVNHARRRGLFVSVATNGTLIPQKIDELRNVSSFGLTLDGPEDVNDLQRGQGTYHKIVEAIRLIKSKGIPVYVTTVLTKHNCHLLDDLVRIVEELGVKLLAQPVFYSAPSHAGTLEGYAKMKYEDGAMAATLRQLVQLKEKRAPYLMFSKKYYSDLLTYLETGRKMKCTFAKKKGTFYATVSPEGYVTPCNLLVRDKNYLNGLELGFRRAFHDMPALNCDGCISSFIEFDYLLNLDQAVMLNYASHYLDLFGPFREKFLAMPRLRFLGAN